MSRPNDILNRIGDAASDARNVIRRADVIAAALKQVLDELQENYPTQYRALNGDYLRTGIADYHKAKE